MRPAKAPALSSSQHKSRRKRAWLLLVLLLAVALRLWGLDAKSLWLDEIMTVEKASKPFAGMMQEIRDHDAHPPLYQVLEWLWLRLGRGDAFARLPSVAAGCAAVWLVYLIARRLLDRKSAIAAALLTALSSFHVYYSQEARLHALATTLFLGQTYLLLCIVSRRHKVGWGWWAAYGLLGLLSLYTYALCILTIAALAVLYIWLRWRRKPQILALVLVHVAIAALFLPWFPILHERTAAVAASVRRLHDAAGRPGPRELTAGIAAWAAGPFGWNGRGSTGPALGLMFLLAAGLSLATRRSPRPAKVLGLLFVLPLAGYLILPMPRVQAYDPKHLVFLQPLLFIALAGAHGPLGRSRRRRFLPLVYAVAATAALNLVTLGRYYQPDFQKENWRTLFRDVDARVKPRDAFIFNPDYVGYAFAYYARTPEGKAGVFHLAQRGKRLGPDIERVWLIRCRSAVAVPSEKIRERLQEKNWQMKEQTRYVGALGYLQWTLFTRSAAPRSRSPRPWRNPAATKGSRSSRRTIASRFRPTPTGARYGRRGRSE